jgi:hypothetical protein
MGRGRLFGEAGETAAGGLSDAHAAQRIAVRRAASLRRCGRDGIGGRGRYHTDRGERHGSRARVRRAVTARRARISIRPAGCPR